MDKTKEPEGVANTMSNSDECWANLKCTYHEHEQRKENVKFKCVARKSARKLDSNVMDGRSFIGQ